MPQTSTNFSPLEDGRVERDLADLVRTLSASSSLSSRNSRWIAAAVPEPAFASWPVIGMGGCDADFASAKLDLHRGVTVGRPSS